MPLCVWRGIFDLMLKFPIALIVSPAEAAQAHLAFLQLLDQEMKLPWVWVESSFYCCY